MTRRIDPKSLRQGMQVFSGEGRQLGTIERTDADSITVNGQQYEFSSVERLEGSKVYLTRQVGASTDAGRAPATGRAQTTEGDLRVEVHEERLDVAKRQVQLGEVQVRTEVVTEQQTVPVELMREEVHVEQRDVADRPMSEADRAGAFQEGTIRIPVRGEEAVVTKEAIVTGEVVINKERTTETERVTDTVRKERIQVDEQTTQAPAPRAAADAPRQAPPAATVREVQVETDVRERPAAGASDVWDQLKSEVKDGNTRARER